MVMYRVKLLEREKKGPSLWRVLMEVETIESGVFDQYTVSEVSAPDDVSDYDLLLAAWDPMAPGPYEIVS